MTSIERTSRLFKDLVRDKFNGYPAKLDSFERILLFNSFNFKNEKLGFGRHSIIIENQFYNLLLDYTAVLSKLAVRYSLRKFREIFIIFLKSSGTLKPYHEDTLAMFYDEKMYDFSLNYIRKMWKLLRSLHKGKGKTLRKYVKEELDSLYPDIDKIPEEIRVIGGFKKYGRVKKTQMD